MVVHECEQEENIKNLSKALFGNQGICPRVEQMANDISWIKKIGGYMTGMIAAILVTLISTGLIFLFKSNTKTSKDLAYVKHINQTIAE